MKDTYIGNFYIIKINLNSVYIVIMTMLHNLSSNDKVFILFVVHDKHVEILI